MPLIVIGGIDGTGKSTQVEKLVERLKHCGLEAVGMSFPRYETVTGKAIKRHLKSQIIVLDECQWGKIVAPEDPLFFQCLQVADKYAAVPEIEEYLGRGVFVVLGRWVESLLIYGSSDGLDVELFGRICDRLPKADLNILLDLDVNQAASRMRDRCGGNQGLDRYEQSLPKQGAIRELYRQLWGAGLSGDRLRQTGIWKIVDASGDLELVHSLIFDVIKEMYYSVNYWSGRKD